MKRLNLISSILFVAMALTVGCTKSSVDQPTGEKYLLTSEPKGGQDVVDAKKTAKDGDDIVIVGRIGGDIDPWVKNRAAFTIVDPAIDSCSDISGDSCPTPWDYCCRTDELPAGRALVKIVDADGKIVKTGAQKLLNVEPLQTVIVQGKAEVDDKGNLAVLATGIFVRK